MIKYHRKKSNPPGKIRRGKPLQPVARFVIIRLRQKGGSDVNTREDYIAVFDSGVGGISVLRELVRLMPGERFLYFGDSANAPYGSRTTEEVRALTLRAAEKLMQQGLKALVIACNTATAAAIRQLREAYPRLIVVGIEPALKMAADRYPGCRVGIMATPVTLREEKLSRQLARFPGMQVSLIPAPGLVELVEAGASREALEALLRPLLAPFAGQLDALVLGCTHYPFAGPVIGSLLPGTVLLDGGEGTARETLRRLREAELLEEGTGTVLLQNSLPDPEILNRCKALLENSLL
ncbi:MAG: glutamate racemase [Clostridia bacterium]|nr:glutamate racemase [Clostridia bacterium]